MFEATRNFYKKTLSPKPVRRSPVGNSDEVLAELMNFCSLGSDGCGTFSALEPQGKYGIQERRMYVQ
jgi:hypothetical protein